MNRVTSYNDALWAIVSQLLFVLFFSTIAFFYEGAKAGASLIGGGLICILPNVYLYRRVFSYFGARAAKHIVTAFYWGEAVKFMLTALGFVAAFFSTSAKMPWVFAGYMVAQFSFWPAPLLLAIWRSKRKNIQNNQVLGK